MFLSVLHDGLLELKEDEGVYGGELVGAAAATDCWTHTRSKPDDKQQSWGTHGHEKSSIASSVLVHTGVAAAQIGRCQ
jgi:hypothetical protein